MAAYATVSDVQSRLPWTMDTATQGICAALLDDAAVMIDDYKESASTDVKKLISCRMVIRALGTNNSAGVPIGANQGSMSGLGYSQSWTISGGATGELYLSKSDKIMLGYGKQIGSYSPVQELVPEAEV